MPVTNSPQTNKRSRKAPGWLISIASKLGLEGLVGGGGAVAGSTVVGTQAATGLSALWGGLLATKAGIVALVLTATTVGAGIYYAGSPDSIPSLARGAGSGIASIFTGSSRSQQAGSVNQQGPSVGGTQDSIQSFQTANQGQMGSENQADNAANGANAAAPTAGNGSTPDNNYSSPSGSARPQLKPTSGLNASNSSSQGGANMMASLPRQQQSETDSNGATGSRRLSSFNQGQSVAGVAAASRRFGTFGARGGAMGQLGATNVTVRGNLAQAGGPSSQGSGYTYDGGRSAAQLIGPGGNSIGGSGASGGGTGVGQGNPTPSPTEKVLNGNPPPPTGPTQNATPWQGAVYAAMGAMALALALLFASSHFKKRGLFLAGTPQGHSFLVLAQMLAMFATAAAAVATMMGFMIMTAFGQRTQGMMYTGIGAALTFYAATMMIRANAALKAQEATNATAQIDANSALSQLHASGAAPWPKPPDVLQGPPASGPAGSGGNPPFPIE